ncbi:MAG: DUF2065 domain-containing protein [Gammaproteobacteria bacterium]|nr:DUF2065 domain-containing protein [Gammaproteobacteria bacterium]
MWHDLLAALALVLVIEGMLPFLNPGAMRKIMRTMSEMDDHSLRISGLVSMALGVAMLYLVN